MGLTWGQAGSCRPQMGPHAGPMNLAIGGIGMLSTLICCVIPHKWLGFGSRRLTYLILCKGPDITNVKIFAASDHYQKMLESHYHRIRVEPCWSVSEERICVPEIIKCLIKGFRTIPEQEGIPYVSCIYKRSTHTKVEIYSALIS